MTIDEARELFGYGSWATALMIGAAEALTREQLEAPVTSSFPSIGATLAHIAGAEWLWLCRWQGESPTSMPIWTGTSTLPEIKAELAAMEAERAAFLDRLTDAAFTALGDDQFASDFLELWDQEGVERSTVIRRAGERTGIYFVGYGAEGHVFSYFRKGSAASLGSLSWTS